MSFDLVDFSNNDVIPEKNRTNETNSIITILNIDIIVPIKDIHEIDIDICNNPEKLEQRILYFTKNYDCSEQNLAIEISNEFNITLEKSLEEIKKIKTKLGKQTKIEDSVPPQKPIFSLHSKNTVNATHDKHFDFGNFIELPSFGTISSTPPISSQNDNIGNQPLPYNWFPSPYSISNATAFTPTFAPYNPNTNGVFAYSFALHPENHQPSGTVNFSNLNTPSLNISYNSFPYSKKSSKFPKNNHNFSNYSKYSHF